MSIERSIIENLSKLKESNNSIDKLLTILEKNPKKNISGNIIRSIPAPVSTATKPDIPLGESCESSANPLYERIEDMIKDLNSISSCSVVDRNSNSIIVDYEGEYYELPIKRYFCIDIPSSSVEED